MDFRLIPVAVLGWFYLAAGYSQSGFQEDPYLKLDHLTTKEGLSNNYILDLHQDPEGFMWIATAEGLNRYDGYEFKHFFADSEDSTSLSSNFIHCLASDSAGNLWVGTRTGLNLLSAKDSGFQNRKNHPDSIFRYDHIRAMLLDNPALWIETAAGELIHFEPGEMTHRTLIHTPPSMVNTYFYHTLLKENDKRIWVGGRYMGILYLDLQSEVFTQIPNDPENPGKKRDSDVAVYFTDGKDRFWVGGIDGLYTFDLETERFTKKLAVSTFTIAEDHDGKLWIGTGGGLYIYDPENDHYIHAVHDDSNPYSLINNHIHKIICDKSGNIWIGTLDGISIFRPSKNKFQHIYHIPGNNTTPVSNHITSVTEDTAGNLWIGTAEKGVDVYNHQWNKIHHFSSEQRDFHRLASNKIAVLSEDREGNLWVGQWSGRGMNIIDLGSKKNMHFRFLKDALMADWYNDILHDREGSHWLGIWGAQGLYQLDLKTLALKDHRYTRMFPGGAVKNLVQYGNKVWIVLQRQQRFHCYDIQTQRIESYSKDHYHSFNFTVIDSILSDGKALYFFTDNGTFRCTRNPYIDFERVNFLKTYVHQAGKEFSRPDWIADSIVYYTHVTDHLGNIWAATDHGLICKTQRNLRSFNRSSVSSGWTSDTIYSLLSVHDSLLLIGTEKGLIRYNHISGRFRTIGPNDERYLSSHLIKFIYEDSERTIWVGTTDKGLNRLYPKSGKIVQYAGNRDDSSAFWGEQASCVVEDDRGTLWFGGYGINRFNPATGSFLHYTDQNGLSHNDIRSLQIARDGNIWISTVNGISRFDPESESFENFYEKDGLQDNEFTGASCILHNGMLVFGGKNGLNIIDPKNIHKNPSLPNVKLTGFTVFDEPYSFQDENNPKIELRYKENYFSFLFTALDFSDPSNNIFQYKLENFDDHWTQTRADGRVAKYTNVDPGEYVFRVNAANSDGVWNNNGIAVPVVIHPPFWKTTMFYMFIVLLFIFTMFLIIKLREKKIQQQNRTLLLEQKLLRSQMNPHFIFNSLSSIQSFIFESNPITAGSYLSRFAELIRSILYNSREELILLDKEISMIKNYLALQQLRYNNKFEYTLEIDPSIDPEILAIPPMLAQPFIENAIEHGIKHLQEKGFIRISYARSNDLLLLEVEDNGIGLSESKKHNGKAKEHRSLATIITKERISILNRSYRNKSYSVQITEIKNEKEIKGTRVKFILPIIKKDVGISDASLP